jgi:hypothetical protein
MCSCKGPEHARIRSQRSEMCFARCADRGHQAEAGHLLMADRLEVPKHLEESMGSDYSIHT